VPVGGGVAVTVFSPIAADIRDRDARITDLTGQLYEPDGTHLADENARPRDLLVTFNKNLQEAQLESKTLRRSLDGARANVKRERERERERHDPLPRPRWPTMTIDAPEGAQCGL
jgi:hypothetical protein